LLSLKKPPLSFNPFTGLDIILACLCQRKAQIALAAITKFVAGNSHYPALPVEQVCCSQRAFPAADFTPQKGDGPLANFFKPKQLCQFY